MNGARVLVAGIGNIFMGDDAFGVEVARCLAARSLPPEVRVVDFGIRGIDLTYALLENYQLVILVDAMARGGIPGTICVVEPSQADEGTMQTHEMTPTRVLAAARAMGASLAHVRIVGCEPESFGTDDAPQLELTSAVRAAVEEAVTMIEAMAVRHLETVHA